MVLLLCMCWHYHVTIHYASLHGNNTCVFALKYHDIYASQAAPMCHVCSVYDCGQSWSNTSVLSLLYV
jgi:hypothetical protein